MCEVVLNVYDVTTSESESTNTTITTLNGITHSLGLGGVFHGAVEVYGEEWSFGYCDSGSGVYSCPPRKNPFYTFRESVTLGITNKSPEEVAAIIKRLKREWPGRSYDLLTHNCCNFCEALAVRLESDPVPAWLNRFATGAESAIVFTDKLIHQVNSWSHAIRKGSQESASKLSNMFWNYVHPMFNDMTPSTI